MPGSKINTFEPKSGPPDARAGNTPIVLINMTNVDSSVKAFLKFIVFS
jgi:hypothetical protein